MTGIGIVQSFLCAHAFIMHIISRDRKSPECPPLFKTRPFSRAFASPAQAQRPFAASYATAITFLSPRTLMLPAPPAALVKPNAKCPLSLPIAYKPPGQRVLSKNKCVSTGANYKNFESTIKRPSYGEVPHLRRNCFAQPHNTNIPKQKAVIGVHILFSSGII